MFSSKIIVGSVWPFAQLSLFWIRFMHDVCSLRTCVGIHAIGHDGMKVQREIDLAHDAVVNVDKHATINSIVSVCSGLATTFRHVL